MGSLAAALRTVMYMAGFLFFFGWVALSIRQFDAALGVILPAAGRPVGVVLMALAACLVLSCGGWFAFLGRGTPAPFDAPTELVVRGPYRWVRNPMYIGGLSLLFGFGLWHRSLSILIMTLVLTTTIHLFIVLFEEPELEQRFGDSYAEYRSAVSRWIPKRPL